MAVDLKKFEEAVEKLQRRLGNVDIMEECDRRNRKGQKVLLEQLVATYEYTKVAINPNEGSHKEPHFHIMYKTEHKASYSIRTLKRLVGEMPKKYETPILDWAAENQTMLMEYWQDIKQGKTVDKVEIERR